MAQVMKHADLPDVAALARPEDAPRAWLDADAVAARLGEHLGTGQTRELWKYSPLRALLDPLAEAADGPLPTLRGAEQPGIRATPLAELPAESARDVRRLVGERLNAERHVLADLALLRAGNGWLVEVKGAPEAPLEIHHGAAGTAPVFLLIEDNAALTVVEHQAAAGLLAQVVHAELAPGAHLTHYRAALERDVPHYVLVSVQMGRDARYRLNQNLVGGTRRRAEVHVVMGEPGAEADLTGAYLVEQGQHLDQQLVVEHVAGHGVSHQKFHGIGAGKGRSIFNGRIHIHPDAPQTDAQLSNRNLALHPEAEMNTKPELEIYTDDVRCAHGATVGQLAADSLFYLTSRGIPEPEARRLLAHGFLRECIEGPLAEAATRRFMEALS